jgi:hypothetical protein
MSGERKARIEQNKSRTEQNKRGGKQKKSNHEACTLTVLLKMKDFQLFSPHLRSSVSALFRHKYIGCSQDPIDRSISHRRHPYIPFHALTNRPNSMQARTKQKIPKLTTTTNKKKKNEATLPN